MLAADKDMTMEPYRVLLYLMSRLDFDNFIYVTQPGRVGTALSCPPIIPGFGGQAKRRLPTLPG